MTFYRRATIALFLSAILLNIGCTTTPAEPDISATVTAIALNNQTNAQLSPLPGFMGFVFPEPGSIVSPGTESYYQELATFVNQHQEESICVGVNSKPLMEIGDAPSQSEFLDQMALSVDGQLIEKTNYVESYDSLGAEYRTEDGELLFRTPDGLEFSICWPAELAEGDHTAVYTFTQTSGAQKSYTWTFTVQSLN